MLEEQDKHGLPQLQPLPATRLPTAADASPAAGAAGAGFPMAGGGGVAVGEQHPVATPGTTAEDAPVGASAAPAAASDDDGDIAAALASARLLTPSAAGA